jgi:serine/threonine-protein kinase
MLRQRGLEPSFQETEPSETIAAGLITRQEPRAGQTVTGGAEVKYWLSSGKPVVTVPDLIRQDINTAARELRSLGLEVGRRIEEFNDESPPGTVLDQNPRAGEEVRSGTTVDLTVSRGPQTAIVPDVIGHQEADASAILANAGFRVNRLREFNDQYEEGRVFAQDPAPSSEAETGSTVDIFISDGPQSFAMPDVRGMTEQEAQDELEGRGLRVQSRTVFTPDPSERGRVVDQNPPPGRTVFRGQEVLIEVGSA